MAILVAHPKPVVCLVSFKPHSTDTQTIGQIEVQAPTCRGQSIAFGRQWTASGHTPPCTVDITGYEYMLATIWYLL